MGFACSCIEKQPEQFTGGLVTKMGAMTIRFILKEKNVDCVGFWNCWQLL